jgi:GNAT superfamily N-acetyltransferase
VPDGFTEIQPLDRSHELDDFDCGTPALNHWLNTFARHSQKVGSARTFVLCPEGSRQVVGFHTLVAASAAQEVAPKGVARDAGPHDVSLVLLARLAVDRNYQKRGLGNVLLKDAFVRTLQAANQVGALALMVHAKDEEAVSFYQHFGFRPSPLQPLQLFLPLKTIRRAMVEADKENE